MNDVPAYLAIVGLIHHAHRGGAWNFPMGAESLMRGLTYSIRALLMEKISQKFIFTF